MPEQLEPKPSSLTREAFIARFGGVYEHSPWVAEALFAQGTSAIGDTLEQLAAAMSLVVETAGHEWQLALLRAHPALAGKLGVGDRLTPDSRSEQASACLDQCSPEEFARFSELNSLYGSKFGFPFIIAVRGLQRADILAAFEQRIANGSDEEFRAALDQVHKIARLRLSALTRSEK